MKLYQRMLFFFIGIVLLLGSSRSLAFAATCPEGETNIDIMCIPNTTSGFVSGMYAVGLGLIGGVSLLYIILGGYYILTSQGDVSRLATGRSYITYAVIGLLLAIFGFVFTTVIAVDILRIPGFN